MSQIFLPYNKNIILSLHRGSQKAVLEALAHGGMFFCFVYWFLSQIGFFQQLEKEHN